MKPISTFVIALALTVPAAGLAQSVPPAPARPGCTEPATPPAGGAGSGTAPGNLGSTGWSGSGQGGSYTGTSQTGPTPGSPGVQPVTARGLDPIKGLPAKANGC